ncbi:hypothetical protein [Methyloglobulus sp.]|uniref:hypothetical protein n=1 Tax=Methyloglobulus sp. TaxID=2518622 RepID=UPI00398A3B88
MTVLAPFKNDNADDLRSYLAKIPSVDVDSPLANIPLTHNARFNIIDDLPFVGAPALYDHLQYQYLLFPCVFDTGNTKWNSVRRDLDTYLMHMFEAIPTEISAIWGHCVGFPVTLTLSAFQGFVKKYQISGGFFFADYPNSSAKEVRKALFEQKQFINFVIKAQDIPDSVQLKADFFEFYKSLGDMPTPPPGSII